MKYFPCKKCPDCGRYSDFTVETCACGRELINEKAFMFDTDELRNNPSRRGEVYKIDVNMVFYVQKCPVPDCMAEYYLKSKDERKSVCSNCHKRRIADVEPVEYSEEKKQESSETGSVPVNERASVRSEKKEEPPENETLYWIDYVSSKQEGASFIPGKSEPDESNTSPVGQKTDNASVNNDKDSEDIPQWPDYSVNSENERKAERNTTSYYPQPKAERTGRITLTAKDNERVRFSLEPEEGNEYMLGRSANQAEYLNRDSMVGNRHCFLKFKDGRWYVYDNNSSNGTAVNSLDIGQNGCKVLENGDELKLGHSDNSPVFRVELDA